MIEAQLDQLISLNQQILKTLEATKTGGSSPTTSTPTEETKPARKKQAAKAEVAEETLPEPAEENFLDDEPAAPVVDKNAVRAALVAYQSASSADKARALMQKFGGADTLGGIPAEKYAVVHAEATKATAAVKK